MVIAKSFARIHWQNLINFGILPLTFVNPDDWNDISLMDQLELPNIREAIGSETLCRVVIPKTSRTLLTRHAMSSRQIRMVLDGSLINLVRNQGVT